MSGLSTHVLDTARGAPAEDVEVTLAIEEEEGWREIASTRTDADGRARLLAGEELRAATYRLRFEVGAYHASRGVEGFHPWIDVTFTVRDPGRHHHVPVLVSPFGYTTYRGS